MRTRRLVVGLVAVASLAGCGTEDDRQWMKINERYTAADFRRDLTACTKNGTLNDDCMRAHGWVALTPKVEKPAFNRDDPRNYSPGRGSTTRY